VRFGGGGEWSNEAYCYCSSVAETSSGHSAPSVCALPGCGALVTQPAGGGRHRLYCSNAHRAEARRRRLAAAPPPEAADTLDAALDRLAAVLDDLRGHREILRSIDPARLALEAARLRAEATAEVLDAQRAAAAAAEEASRVRDQLASERASWDDERQALEAELAGALEAAAAARREAGAVQDALDAALTAHRVELAERDHAGARAAAAHEAELGRLARDLDAARTAAAAAEARAEAADRRAASSEAEARSVREEARRPAEEAQQLRLDLERAQAAATVAAARAESAERVAAELRAELGEERRRHDEGVAGLRHQLEQLVSGERPPPSSPDGETATAAQATPAAAARGRPSTKPWKVVRHHCDVDPFEQAEWVYTSHTTERAARQARDRLKAQVVRSSGHEAADAWAWSVVHDPSNALTNPAPTRSAP
jgi:hypothetical protein